MQNIKEMTKQELWVEIVLLVNATHYTETDKDTFIKLIEEFSFK